MSLKPSTRAIIRGSIKQAKAELLAKIAQGNCRNAYGRTELQERARLELILENKITAVCYDEHGQVTDGKDGFAYSLLALA